MVYQAGYAEDAAHKTADYAEHSRHKIEQSCYVISPAEKAECVEKARTEYSLQASDKEREYQDLLAQRTSALWTQIMGIAALIGMALSLVGVVLVYVTFRETRRSTDAVRLGTDAQVIAKVAATHLRFRPPGADFREAAYGLDIRNFGQTPAYGVQASGTLRVGSNGSEPIEKVWNASVYNDPAHVDGADIGSQDSITLHFKTDAWDDLVELLERANPGIRERPNLIHNTTPGLVITNTFEVTFSTAFGEKQRLTVTGSGAGDLFAEFNQRPDSALLSLTVRPSAESFRVHSRRERVGG